MSRQRMLAKESAMKIEFNYTSATRNAPVKVSINTVTFGNETVFTIYHDGEYEYMTDTLLALLDYVMNHYSVARMEEVKSHFL